MDWPRHGAFLTLPSEGPFTKGAQELACSIDRALDPEELERGTEAALELLCQLPDGAGPARVHVWVAVPEAIAATESLVGVENVTLFFSYGTGSLKAPWTQARYFSIVDDDGPLFLAQWSSCGDDLSATKSECELFGTASELAPEWSEPLPEPRLGEVGCGTREWEFVNPPAIGTFDMYRLAVRFDTDDGVVDVLARHAASVNLGTQSYEIFATDVVGEVDDPSVIYGGTGYHQYAAFFMVRTP